VAAFDRAQWLPDVLARGHPGAVPDVGPVLPPDFEPDPAALVDQQGRDDWAWSAR